MKLYPKYAALNVLIELASIQLIFCKNQTFRVTGKRAAITSKT